MDLYRLSAFVHIVFAILLAGLALFWLVMHVALDRRSDATDAPRLLGVAHRARWPHVVIPYASRLPLPWVAWLVFLVLGGTGLMALASRGWPLGPLWLTKLALIAAIAFIQLATTHRPRAALIRIYFVLVLATIAVSGWAIR
jgi:hypothetical protein